MVYKKVSVLIPTRGRVERLRKMLDSYNATANPASSELIFRIDEDDLPTRSFLEQAGEEKVIVGPRLGGYKSMGTFFNEMVALSCGEILMCGNDDMVFETVKWADIILYEAQKYPDGLFDFGVSTHNKAHFPFACVSRRAVEHLGHLWDPRIYWGDVYLRDVMAAFGRAISLPHVSIAHDWVGWNPDQTFVEGDQNRIYAEKPRYWQDVHAPVVSEAIERLRPLVEAA